jgi:hypothetical protein
MRLPLIFFLCIAAVSVSGQYDNIPNPEFEGQPYYFDKSAGKLVQLEKTTARMKSKSKWMGYGGIKSSYQIKGEKSTVMIFAADTSIFVQSGADMMINMMDPSKFILLYKLEVNKGNREAILQQTGFSGKEKKDSGKIPFNTKKDDSKMFFVFTNKLSPGEYAFISMLNMSGGTDYEVHCFRVEQ